MLAWISASMQCNVMDEALPDFVGREGLNDWTSFIQTPLCDLLNSFKKLESVSSDGSIQYLLLPLILLFNVFF